MTLPKGGGALHRYGACALLSAALFATGCEAAYDDVDGMEDDAFLEVEEQAPEELAEVVALEADEEMGVAMLLGERCDAVFDFVNRSSPLPLDVSYAYHEDGGAGQVPNIMQGHLAGSFISNGVRGSGPQITSEGLGHLRAVQFDLKKQYLGRQHIGSTINLLGASGTGIVMNKSFAPTSCQDHGTHATLYGDSADGSHILLTYKRFIWAQ